MRRYQVRKRRKAPCVTHLQYFSVVNHKSGHRSTYRYHNRFNPLPPDATPLGTRRWSWCAQYRHAHTCASPLHAVRNGTRRAEDKPSLMDNLATTMPPSAPSVAGEARCASTGGHQRRAIASSYRSAACACGSPRRTARSADAQRARPLASQCSPRALHRRQIGPDVKRRGPPLRRRCHFAPRTAVGAGHHTSVPARLERRRGCVRHACTSRSTRCCTHRAPHIVAAARSEAVAPNWTARPIWASSTHSRMPTQARRARGEPTHLG